MGIVRGGDDPLADAEEYTLRERLKNIEDIVRSVPFGAESIPDPQASSVAVQALRLLFDLPSETPGRRITCVRANGVDKRGLWVTAKPGYKTVEYDFVALSTRMLFGRGHPVTPASNEETCPSVSNKPSREELEARPYRTLVFLGPPAACSRTFADAMAFSRRLLRRALGADPVLAAEDGCEDDAELERRADASHVPLYVRWPDEGSVVTAKGAFAVIVRRGKKI